MSSSFFAIVNKKYKKINSKVRFVGVRPIIKSYNKLNSGALISTGYGLLSSSEIESVKKTIKKIIGKSKRIKILLRVYPYIPLTGKPSEVRMGRGKGSRIRKWVCFVKPGKILFELKNISKRNAKIVLNMVKEKLSVNSKFFSNFLIKSKKYQL